MTNMMQEYRVVDFIKAVLENLKAVGVFTNNLVLEKTDDDLNRDTDNWKATLTIKNNNEEIKFIEKFNSYEVNSGKLAEIFADRVLRRKELPAGESSNNNFPVALSFAQKVVKYLTEKGVNIIDTSVYKYEPRRRIEEWVFKVRTEKKTGVRVVFDLKMNTQMVANRVYNMILKEENSMCYTSLFNDGRSHAQLIINKANGEANHRLIQEGLLDNDREGIFINALDYDEVMDEWVLDIVHEYEGAGKHFKYPVTEDVEGLTVKMIEDWKKEKGLM